MLMKNGPCLKEAINFLFSGFYKKPASLQNIRDTFNRVVANTNGLAVMERLPGDYAFAIFVREMIPQMADAGVRTMYVSFLPAAEQGTLDRWQDQDDEQPIIDFIDGYYYGHSKRQWQHYWEVMQTAKAKNVRVVGLRKDEIQSKYGNLFDVPFKTMFWESTVSKDRANRNETGKYFVYGDALHAVDKGGALKSIHQRLDIPRLILASGEHSITPLVMDPHESYIFGLPMHQGQDPVTVGPFIRSVPIRHHL